MRQLHRLEPRRPRLLREQRDRRGAAGDDAERRQDRDRGQMPDGPARSRIEHVAVAHAFDLDAALVVAARRERALRDRDRRDEPVRSPRMPDADPPRRAVGSRPDRAHVAAEIHERVLDPCVREHARSAVGRVLLHDPTEVELEPGQDCPNVLDGRIDELIYLGDHIRVRLTVADNDEFIVKVPNASEHPTLERGNAIRVGWQAEDCRALDPS